MKRFFQYSVILIFSLCALYLSSCKKGKDKAAEKIPDNDTEITESPAQDFNEAEELSENAAEPSDEELLEYTDDMSIEELANYEAEEERIAASIEALENHISDGETEENFKTADEFCGRDDLLSFSQFDDEVIEVSRFDDKRVMIYSIGNKVNRRFFDEEYRLIKTEYWEIASFDNSKIYKKEFFHYKGDEHRYYMKTVDYDEGCEDYYYRPDGIVEKSESYKKVKGKKYITEICRWTFDSQKRITQVKTRTFSYNDEEDTKRRDVFVKTFTYKYNPPAEDGQEIPPDVKYYENDVLKSYERYSVTPGSYTQHYYFDNGISIKTWYVDNKKVREIVYQNDKVMRVNKIDEDKSHLED